MGALASVLARKVVYIFETLLLVTCYDNKKVKSLADPTIIPLVGARGGKPTNKN